MSRNNARGRKSAYIHSFAIVPQVKIPRSSFMRPFRHITTWDMDKLYPILAEEILPGDVVHYDMSLFGRLNTPLVPFYDNIYFYWQAFFVPNRLVWKNWQKLCGEQENPGDSTDYLTPVANYTEVNQNSLANYMGVGCRPGVAQSICALPLRAYNLIYNQWYRDENLQDSLTVKNDDTPDNGADYTIQTVAKIHDYFTSALPWPQKTLNGQGVQMPLGVSAPIFGPVVGTGYSVGLMSGSAGTTPGSTMTGLLTGSNSGVYYGSGNPVGVGSASYLKFPEGVNSDGKAYSGLEIMPGKGYADLSTATAATVNAVRTAFAFQRVYERDARVGTRYPEILLGHYGVVSPDARLQIPEYLGGGKSHLILNSVAQNSATDGTSPQGNLAAYGVMATNNQKFSHSFVEHGWLLVLGCLRADLTYSQGCPRQFSRRTRFDYWWPEFSFLGEQYIKNKELFVSGTAADEEAFGYQEYGAEYRYGRNTLSGLMSVDANLSLGTKWTLSQKFTTTPGLNSDFIKSNTPISNVVAVTNQPAFTMDFYIKSHWTRPMPAYSVPGLIDHF